jgi:hypothetical protein
MIYFYPMVNKIPLSCFTAAGISTTCGHKVLVESYQTSQSGNQGWAPRLLLLQWRSPFDALPCPT